MSRFANNALLGGGVRVWIREQKRKIKRRLKALLSLCWQSWTSLVLASSKEGKGKGSSLLPKLSPAEVPHFPQLKHTMTDKAGCSVTGDRN